MNIYLWYDKSQGKFMDWWTVDTSAFLHDSDVINTDYRKLSNIRRTKFQNLTDSCLVLNMSLPNLLKPGVKYRMKM